MVHKDHELLGSLPEIGLDHPGLAAHINQVEWCIQRAEESIYGGLEAESRAPRRTFESQPNPSPVPLAELQQRVSDAGTSGPQLETTSEMPGYGSYYPQQEYQQTRSPFLPGAPGLGSVYPPFSNMQSTHTGSTSYPSFFPVHSSDYDFSQPTSEELQQMDVTGGYLLVQLPTNTSGVASFGPMMAAQVEPPPDVNFSPPAQTRGYRPRSSCKSTRSKNLDGDRVWACGRVSKKPRRQVSKKPRRQFSDGEREETNTVRQMGSCARCKALKLRCDKGNPCKRCLENGPKARTYFGPCYRGNLEELTLVRQGNSEFDQELMAFRDYSWKQQSNLTETKTLYIKWTIPKGDSSKLPVFAFPCQEYDPRPGDVTQFDWQENGCVTSLVLPTFACRNRERLLEIVGSFLRDCQPVVEADRMNHVTDELERLTFSEATRIAKRDKSSILQLALRIHTNTILSAGWGTPAGTETLGIPRIVNASAGHVGDRPLPPAIDHQIDVAIWETIRKDQQSLLKKLKQKLYNKGPKQWLELFLTFFVSLANIQYVHGRATEWMKCQQQTDAALRVTYLVKKMIGHWNFSAKNIIYHFRTIFRGDVPLVAAEKDLNSFKANANLDDQSTTYVRRVLDILKKQGEIMPIGTIDSTKLEVTESGDHWTRQLFASQYLRSS